MEQAHERGARQGSGFKDQPLTWRVPARFLDGATDVARLRLAVQPHGICLGVAADAEPF